MTWSSGRIDLDCGHAVGIADWDKLWVGASTFCPTHKRQSTVVSMSRIYEATGSRNFQLGLVGGDEGDPEGPERLDAPAAPAP